MAAITAGTWLLESTVEDATTESFFPDEQSETVFFPDKRVLVDSVDFATGGELRSIVKLQMRFEYQSPSDKRWAIGTGWLIRPDLLVTAGHCVFDWDRRLGRCRNIKAYIGYNGASSVRSADVQFRHGKKVVTTDEWLKNSDTSNDVAFIQLDQAFTGVEPFEFCTTPMTGSTFLGIVGYPGDKILQGDPDGERGPQMYKSFCKIDWNLAKSDDNMLEYRIDTFGGQSGSPVLRQSDFKAIGTHVVGGSDRNFASLINGRYGIPYSYYISVFDCQYETVEEERGVTYVRLPRRQAASESFHNRPGPEEFWNDMKSAFNVAAPIAGDVLDTRNLVLGSVSGPITALAGTALGAAAKLARPEKSFAKQVTDNAHMYRATLAEAALSVVGYMDNDIVQELGIWTTMQSVHGSIAAQAKLLAPKLYPILIVPALRITLDALNKQQSGCNNQFPDNDQPQHLDVSRGLPEASDQFTRQLLEPTVRETDNESFWNILGDVLSIAGQMVWSASQAETSFNDIAAEDQGVPNPLQQEKDLVNLITRAIMGEAALQALQQTDPEYLKNKGFLAGLKSEVQKIGPIVMKLAPGVIEAVGQIIEHGRAD